MYRTKNVNGKEVRYFEKNNNSKWTVIFVHGFNSSSNFASHLFTLKNDYNIIAVDMVDMNTADEVEFDEMVKIIDFFIKKARTRRVVLLGHSLAGGVVSKVGIHPKVKRIIYMSTITPEIQKTKAYKLLKKHHETKGKIPLLISNKIIEMTRGKYIWAHAFLDRDSKWTGILNNTVLDDRFMKRLDTRYKLTKYKAEFVVSKDDGIISTRAFVKYANSLNKDVTFIGKRHNPIKTAPHEFNQYLNAITEGKKRFFKKGVIR
ncbi:alpha/beta hydrolase [Mycoplasma todarodis]|uniref:AB hydrolase-1 domain-containing protein n=1 Tax=Mycoplasma todarodis TaxID=1937191 RepID=A0A4R0XP28_9MOLU|nr:alpha/beta fold hydrolase [Mycoplasma todarodis]TCG11262.1 hypothetical protein C4B25_01995 [Mycoplasma todarodis]